jgi:pimeloyl-ACP methyl ester carboxylesterase
VTIGHSQGGQAALFTAIDANGQASQLHLKGAVAIAPGSGFGQTIEFVKSGQAGAEAAEPFLPLLVLGAAAADPAIDPDKVFAPQFKPFVTATRTQCLNQVRALTPIPPKQVFTVGANLVALTEYLAQQEPSNLTPQVPLMVAQGLADITVQSADTDSLVKRYCSKHFDVDYRTYPGVDHRGAVVASFRDVADFVGDVLSGRSEPGACKAA